jgi:hypothetical protein
MKRRMRRLLVRADGSVSLYLVAITAAVFLFMAVLIDYARIAAFERHAETSAYAAARSMLSAYDEILYARYGLFGRGGTDGAEIASRILESNAAASGRGGAFKLLDIRVEDVRVQTEGMLGQHAILKRQILEEMKYKAPIDLSIEVAGKFRALSGTMDEATRTVNQLEELRKLYDARQRHLLAAHRAQQNAAAAVSGSGIDALIPAMAGGQAAGDTAAGVAAGYSTYVGWVEEDRSRAEDSDEDENAEAENEDEDKGPLHEADIAAYEASARSTAFGIRQAALNGSSRHAGFIQSAMSELDAAEAVNDRMAAVMRTVPNDGAAPSSSGHGRLAKSKPAAIGSGGQPDISAGSSEMNSLRAEADRLVLAASWFQLYRNEMAAQGAAAAALDGSAAAFQSSVSNALAAPSAGRILLLSDQARSLAASYRQYAGSYLGTAPVLAARERSIREGDAADAERTKLEKQASAKLGEARRLLGQLTALPATSEAAESYRRLQELYDRNRAWNEAVGGSVDVEDDAVDDAGSIESGLSGDSGSYAEQSMNRSDGMFGFVADALSGMRDELYLNEYAVHRFTAFQPQNLSAVATGGTPAGEALSQAIALHNQEVEYVIYGMHDPASNLAAAFGEIFAVRVAIRTMEGLIEKRPLGHPLVVLAAAVLHGIEKAIEDMITLVQRGSTPLSKYAAVDIAYRDYLRLFLFLHGSEQAKLSRIAALIEHHTGYDLHAIPTALAGEFGSSLNLWFLPGIGKAMARSGILRGKVEEGRYETTRTIVWSYS